MKLNKKSIASFIIALIMIFSPSMTFADSSPGTIHLYMSEEMTNGNNPNFEGQENIYVGVEKFLPGTYSVVVKSPGRNGTALGSGEINVGESGSMVFNLYQVTQFVPTDNIAGLYTVVVGDNKSKNFTLDYIEIKPDYWDVSFAAGPNGSLSGILAFTDILDGTNWDHAVTVPTAIPDAGYQFDGWDLSFPETIEQDWTFTAQFSLIPVELDYWDVSFATGPNGSLSGTLAFTDILDGTNWDQGVTVPTAVPDAGYQFDGWDLSFPEIIEQDWTFTAQFSLIPVEPEDPTPQDERVDRLILEGFIPIANAAELRKMRNSYPDGELFAAGTKWEKDYVTTGLGDKYVLVRDIDMLSADDWLPVGTIIDPFTGVFDGNDYEIINLISRNSNNTSPVGLFGYVENGLIRYLDMSGPLVAGSDYVGAVAGRIRNTHVMNVRIFESRNEMVDAAIYGSLYVGGLVGYSENSTIEHVVNEAAVIGTASVGGIAGGQDVNSRISDAINKGYMSSYSEVGGIIGINYGVIYRALNQGTVIGQGSVGGIAGYTNGGFFDERITIEQAANTGDVKGESFIGGIAGFVDFTIMSDVYNTGTIGPATLELGTGDILYAGGIAGRTYLTRISNAYVSSRMIVGSSDYYVDQLVGLDENGTNVINGYYNKDLSDIPYGFGIALDNEQMTDAASFAGFDFVDVWGIDAGETYPYLRWHSGFYKPLKAELP